MRGYDDAMDGFRILDDIYRKAWTMPRRWLKGGRRIIRTKTPSMLWEAVLPWGQPTFFSICNIMEMLQIDSPTVNCCEFFHGPF